MMILDKIRKHWAVVLLSIFLGYFILKNFNIGGLVVNRFGPMGGVNYDTGVAPMLNKTAVISSGMIPIYQSDVAPTEQSNRMVVMNTSLSMKVSDVRKSLDQIIAQVTVLGGFMVESSLNVPEDSANGSVSLRIPSAKLDQGLAAIRSLGIKVISENVMGTDVTDQYVDIAARLDTLQKTKAKFEQIMAGATQVADLLNMQREIINLQSQIDSLVGQQKYLEQTAKLSLVTVYLATDELALPYAPSQAWRPGVILKEAVRSLVLSVRGVGSALIWVLVYSPLWLPIVAIIWWVGRRRK